MLWENDFVYSSFFACCRPRKVPVHQPETEGKGAEELVMAFLEPPLPSQMLCQLQFNENNFNYYT